ncbi:long-chain-fatty-acid--AMP ligase FadD28 [Mycobacterium tuberculosis]|nr:long-chain-fatty-acid--AMP ligase FadD28 [Mycobacterium tuberculosis]
MASRQTPAELARCDLAKTAEREHTPTATATTPSVAGNVMPMSVRSLPAALRACARLQPHDPAFTFMDYEQDWDGVAITLTWSQLYRRTLNVAQELSRCGSTGDRVVISAPQGLEYVVAFLGALQAGRIAVPLSVPQGGVTDERSDSVLSDSSPVAILTTSSAVDDVVQHVARRPGNPRHQLSKLICSIWTLRMGIPSKKTSIHLPRICNTPPGPPARPLAW